MGMTQIPLAPTDYDVNGVLVHIKSRLETFTVQSQKLNLSRTQQKYSVEGISLDTVKC